MYEFSEPVVCILSGLVLCILSGLGRSYIVYNNQTHAFGHIPFKNAVLKSQSESHNHKVHILFYCFLSVNDSSYNASVHAIINNISHG